MDKPWAERLGGAPYDEVMYYDELRGWEVLEATARTDTYETPVLKPQARLSSSPVWEDHGNAWSAAMGAIFGAGTVLVIAAVFLLWKRPRKREVPRLAPLDVGHNGKASIDRRSETKVRNARVIFFFIVWVVYLTELLRRQWPLTWLV